MQKGLKIFFVILGILVLGNLGFLDFRMWREGGKVDVGRKVESGSESGTSTKSVDCTENCQNQITQKIKEEVAKIVIPTGSIVYKTQTSTSTEPKIVYVPISANGEVSSINFIDMVPSEFYFDLSDYPGAKEVRFQAYLLSINNDLAYARLYDNTNKRGVDFSDIQTDKSTFTRIESHALSIWRGNNKYTIQLRSVNGTNAQLKDAKLKIIF